MADLLVIGDPHADPRYDNDRFTWLGRYIVDTRPEFVVCMGDYGDFHSLSSYDRGKASGENSRFQEDLDSLRDADKKLWAPLHEYNARRRKNKKATWSPDAHLILGNHEARIDRFANDNPAFAGTLTSMNLSLDPIWKTQPFKHYLFLEGIAFIHYVPTAMGYATGCNNMSTILKKNYMSTVVGHSHIYRYTEDHKPDGEGIFALSAGCYAHADMGGGYAAGTDHKWWRGVVCIKGVKNGFGAVEKVPQEYLAENYGNPLDSDS